MPAIIIVIKVNANWGIRHQVGYLYPVPPANIIELGGVVCSCGWFHKGTCSGVIKAFGFHLYGKGFCLHLLGKTYLDTILWQNRLFVGTIELA
jgi:hypothetical protein